jgi:hypothetical protein
MACRFSFSTLVIAAGVALDIRIQTLFDDDEQIDVIGREASLVNAS